MLVLTIILGILVLFSGLITIEYFFQGTSIREARLLGRSDEQCRIGSPLFLDAFSLLTNTAIFDSNRVELLLNGEQTYPRMWADLRGAERWICFQCFWMRPGTLANELAEILAERARAGLRVQILIDYVGARPLLGDWADGLRKAGVEVGIFRSLHIKGLYKFQQRTHVRAVVIDGKIGYTGGFAIADTWQGGGRAADEWRDTNLRVEGSSVDQIQAAFASSWLDATGQLLLGDEVFSIGDDAGGDTLEQSGLVYAKPGLDSTVSERYYGLTIAAAHTRLWITNAYFIPDKHFRRLLIDAYKRGVDVRVLTPGLNTDRRSSYYAARGHYEELLEGGIRIYHYTPGMIHAKTIVADGVWCAIGSCNFDNRSMSLNDEIQFVAQDAELGERMEAVFLADLEYAEEVRIEDVRQRGLHDRILERAAHVVAPIL